LDLELISEINSENFSIEINGEKYWDRETAGIKLLENAEIHMKSREFHEYQHITIGKYNGFDVIIIRADNLFQNSILALKNNLCHKSTLSTSPHGNLIKLDNIMSKMPKEEIVFKERIAKINANIEAAKAQLSLAFEHEDELNTLSERQQEINTQLEFGEEREELIENEIEM